MSQPADSPAAPAPTVRDEVAVTRLDGPAPTVRDDAPPPRTLMQLPSALAGRYRIVRPLPTAGGEADLLLVDAGDGQRYVAKLYATAFRSNGKCWTGSSRRDRPRWRG